MRIYANNNDIIANIRLSDILEATRSENMVFTCEAKRNEANSNVKWSEYLFAKTILAKRMRIFIREIYPSEANIRNFFRILTDAKIIFVCASLRISSEGRPLDQRQLRQKIRHRRSTNIIIYTRKEAELQLLDDQFKMRIREATRNITTMQKNEANAVYNNNNNEMYHHSSTPPPEEEPPD